MDRGYGHVAAQQSLWINDGIYSNAIIQANRLGLPRQFIEQVRADLDSCSTRCTHKPDERDCRKFMWTVVHKDEFETTLWQDSQLIISYGNFFSGIRAGLMLHRGAAGDKESYAVWVPESIFHYNIEGRSATDSADQVRKKLSVAERRTERAGPKGIAFVFDVAFTNGSILQRMLQPEGMKRSKLDEFNKCYFEHHYSCQMK
ncbi:hypothetical protein AB1Y20_009704 [Prymnesium parvum]|uniref:Uncharacterized protein n=1 Tax=Prymnesium parvum TaxID=97485 RepID=A0AB34K2T2_PRYPA